MIPTPLGSTYRLQLPGLGFEGARALVSYLSDLGVETLYVSPILAAAPGSAHGYDVIDPTRLDPALGSPLQFEKLLKELDAFDMRLLIDIVPNHMACQRSNAWWWDVLRLGQSSKFASTFDIDWSRHVGRVLVPTLPEPLEELLDSIHYVGEGTERVMEIGDQDFPLAPGTRTGSDLSAVLARQHYQPAYWRLSNHEGNYRRFFDIDGLVGVRVEDDEVFQRTHGCITALARDDRIAGWRVDHIDGLTDPGGYLTKLRSATTNGRTTEPIVLVEKILGSSEELPASWSSDGTTGYEFANIVGGLFVSDDGARRLATTGERLTGEPISFRELGLEAKREAITNLFDAGLERLARLAMNALNELRPGHDLSWFDVRRALCELTVHLDVYRTYFSPASATSCDLQRLARARDAASEFLAGEAQRAVLLVAEVMTAPGAGLDLAQRWQQLSGAVMAKGVEDTATYRYSGLLSHAEVGCDPDHASAQPEEFHHLARDHRRRPSTLNATSTHDSKRSEDARARLFVLSELPDEWSGLIARWHRRHGHASSEQPLPDVRDQLVTFQSFVAVWPVGSARVPRDVVKRVQNYAIKAAREAKRQTSWTDPDTGYERALTSFVSALARNQEFCDEMARFVHQIAPASAANGLAMTVLKCVAPGVPDFYQGTELWDHSLTDPDNRRPVDFLRRRSLLERLPDTGATPAKRRAATRQLLARWSSGALKLYITREMLALRRTHRDLFATGAFEVLEVTGPQAEHVVAIARQHNGEWVLAIVARQTIDIAGAGRFPTGNATWGTRNALRVPATAPSQFQDIFTGATLTSSRGRLDVGDSLAELPVAVLVGRE
jgi:(1->4)-alpha-D-glucan 1-alpha-D-glucosylmutase